jgi:hypothetical protein
VDEKIISARGRWTYYVPLTHLLVCLAAASGYVIPSLHSLGIIFTFLDLVDLPISLVYIALAWGHEALAMAWLFVAGTLWWYLLCWILNKWIDHSKSDKKDSVQRRGI